MTYNEKVYKYYLHKIFYKKTNKQEYKLQILIYNIRYINIIFT